MEVYRTTVTIDVFQAAESAEKAQAMLAAMTLDEILHETDEGAMIAGTPVRSMPEHIHRDAIEAEMLAIGSDGSFFDMDLDDHEDVPEAVGGDEEDGDGEDDVRDA